MEENELAVGEPLILDRDPDAWMPQVQEHLMRWFRGEDLGALWHRATADVPVPSVSLVGPPLPWWTAAHNTSPAKPVLVGTDPDGRHLYVGRGWHQGQLLPAKVTPEEHGAVVSWDGREHRLFNFQFEVLQLLRGRAEWIEASDGVIPAHAFPIGITTGGRATYAARAPAWGDYTLGRLVDGDSRCYVPLANKEWAFRNYEVLAIM